MFRLFKFVKDNESHITIKVPKALQGKLVEITFSEKAPDDDTILNDEENEMMDHKKVELQILDKIRNQLNVWDI